MTPLVDEKGQPIEVPAGPLDAALKDKITQAVNAQVPPGKRFAVVGLYDFNHEAIDIQVATRLGNGFEFASTAKWDDDQVTGYVGVSWSF